MKRYRFLMFLLTLALVATVGSSFAAPGKDEAPAAKAGDADKPGVQLTVYNENFALVRDRRELEQELKAGLNILPFRDVAATIEATSVHFRSLTDPDAQVVEQNYEFDLVNGEKLLQKYIDQQITVHTKDNKQYGGILMSFDERQLVLAEDREKGPIYVVERGGNIKRIAFSSLPEGLLTRPTLVWEVESKKPGKHLVEVSYLANNIRWRADYNIVLNPDDTLADVSGWVTIENKTGTAYENAGVKLLAGDPKVDPNRITLSGGPDYYKLVQTQPPSNKIGNDPSRAFGDYRMYSLPEKTTVGNNQIKQIELITASKVPLTKTYLYDGAKVQFVRSGRNFDPNMGRQTNKKVNVLVEMQNRADENLGISLPKGKCRTYKKDTDGSLEFIGEDLINHIARDEKVVLYIGDAFDIVGDRKQTTFRKVNDREYIESFEIKIRNHKKEDVTVKVLEKLYRGGEWTVLQKSHNFEQLDSRTIVFPIKVPADKEITVTYEVDYKW